MPKYKMSAFERGAQNRYRDRLFNNNKPVSVKPPETTITEAQLERELAVRCQLAGRTFEGIKITQLHDETVVEIAPEVTALAQNQDAPPQVKPTQLTKHFLDDIPLDLDQP